VGVPALFFKFRAGESCRFGIRCRNRAALVLAQPGDGNVPERAGSLGPCGVAVDACVVEQATVKPGKRKALAPGRDGEGDAAEKAGPALCADEVG
jgi:hypothetical protein